MHPTGQSRVQTFNLLIMKHVLYHKATMLLHACLCHFMDKAKQKTKDVSSSLALSSVHQRLWIATLSQPFKSMEIQSTMYQILDTLVPWWHLAQVTSKGESHLLGGHSGSWNNFGRVHTYPLQQKLSCLILPVSLYYSMAMNHGWSPRIWKTKSTPLLPHATESCWI